mmetsp:Transcript_44549/g.135766  ORF Transcript_44549/g.135766 Transcript_44549/m.135766 type:complete len:212 (-) Transcript_44549:816-1451(-)
MELLFPGPASSTPPCDPVDADSVPPSSRALALSFTDCFDGPPPLCTTLFFSFNSRVLASILESHAVASFTDFKCGFTISAFLVGSVCASLLPAAPSEKLTFCFSVPSSGTAWAASLFPSWISFSEGVACSSSSWATCPSCFSATSSSDVCNSTTILSSLSSPSSLSSQSSSVPSLSITLLSSSTLFSFANSSPSSLGSSSSPPSVPPPSSS